MSQVIEEYRDGLRGDYRREGYVVAQGVIDQSLVDEARAHIRWLLDRHPGVRPEQLHSELMQDDPFWVRLISDERLLDVAETFIGPNVALFASHYIAKRPFDGQSVLWHQDGGFWPLEPMEVVTLWLSLDEVDQENGCLRMIPGTQKLDIQATHERKDVDNVLGAEMDLSQVDEDRAVDVVLRPGDVEIHHPNLIHGSHANTSSRWRRGLTIRYIPTSTRILSDKPFPSAFLLRGEALPGVNEYQPWPRYRAGDHMPFSGKEEWNDSSEEWNDRMKAFLVSP
ncbi:MAG: phytanoyl-CoA dioxygenase family protein [Trueperaceae bacterium]